MPGLAKYGRRADTSGVGVADGFGDLDGEVRGDPEMRRGCIGRFPGSRIGTGTGIVQEKRIDWECEGEDQREREREREVMDVS